jgi:hypothetical protein
MLTEGEAAEIARDKVLLYAALNMEAGQIYTQLGNRTMARASFLNALRLTLRARKEFPAENLPPYTPSLAVLRESLADTPLDPGTAEMLKAAEG